MDCLLREFFNHSFNIKSRADFAISHDTASTDACVPPKAGAKQSRKLLYHDPLLLIHGVNHNDTLPLGTFYIDQKGRVWIISLYLISFP